MQVVHVDNDHTALSVVRTESNNINFMHFDLPNCQHLDIGLANSICSLFY